MSETECIPTLAAMKKKKTSEVMGAAKPVLPRIKVGARVWVDVHISLLAVVLPLLLDEVNAVPHGVLLPFQAHVDFILHAALSHRLTCEQANRGGKYESFHRVVPLLSVDLRV